MLCLTRGDSASVCFENAEFLLGVLQLLGEDGEASRRVLSSIGDLF